MALRQGVKALRQGQNGAETGDKYTDFGKSGAETGDLALRQGI